MSSSCWGLKRFRQGLLVSTLPQKRIAVAWSTLSRILLNFASSGTPMGKALDDADLGPENGTQPVRVDVRRSSPSVKSLGNESYTKKFDSPWLGQPATTSTGYSDWQTPTFQLMDLSLRPPLARNLPGAPPNGRSLVDPKAFTSDTHSAPSTLSIPN